MGEAQHGPHIEIENRFLSLHRVAREGLWRGDSRVVDQQFDWMCVVAQSSFDPSAAVHCREIGGQYLVRETG
ncbi:hypothetical protein FM21_36115 [Streptomyces mutabilis]|uniref:Uncharacterized protein n=1 Tax=Streptomyces mutabilis TaxID=67332 RepID=A0A086MQL9_9ACTN|nr:hypothetical protein [Streptomyces mutabilis]KFG71187.1 hypothetical protein FM21_36115 [Streptomyces mutabilis]